MASKTRCRPSLKQREQIEAWFLAHRDQIRENRLTQTQASKAATQHLGFRVTTSVLASIAGSRAVSKYRFAWPGAAGKTSTDRRRVGRVPGQARDELTEALRRLIREEVHLLLQGVVSSPPR